MLHYNFGSSVHLNKEIRYCDYYIKNIASHLLNSSRCMILGLQYLYGGCLPFDFDELVLKLPLLTTLSLAILIVKAFALKKEDPYIFSLD